MSSEAETGRVARAAGTIGLYTLVSRVLGFIRDMVVARAFGASAIADAFYVAFRIPNLFRELLAEGTMSAAFVPVFTELLTRRDRDAAWRLASRIFTLLLLAAVVVTCIGVLAAPLIVQLIAPGFDRTGSQHELTVLLTRIMFPYLIFMSLSALAMGMLNSLRSFSAPAMAPLSFNLMIIGCALWLAPHMETPALGLAIGVLLGGFAQFAVQIPALIGQRMVPIPRWQPNHPAVRKVGALIIPVIFGLSVTQVNLLVNTLLASYLDEGSVSYLYYGMRLIHFPLGIFGVALATAILPSLSALAARGDLAGVANGVRDGLRLILYVMIPAMIGLMALRIPMVSLLFERGAFDSTATAGVAGAVLAYASGLWAFATVRIAASTFYAMQDTATPVRIAAIAMAVNLVLNLALMGPLAHMGLALATALAAMVNVGLLLWALGKRLPDLALSRLWPSVARTVVAALVMGGLCSWAANQPIWEDGLFGQTVWMTMTLSVAGLTYLLIHRLIGGDEGPELLRAVRARRNR